MLMLIKDSDADESLKICSHNPFGFLFAAKEMIENGSPWKLRTIAEKRSHKFITANPTLHLEPPFEEYKMNWMNKPGSFLRLRRRGVQPTPWGGPKIKKKPGMRWFYVQREGMEGMEGWKEKAYVRGYTPPSAAMPAGWPAPPATPEGPPATRYQMKREGGREGGRE